MDVGIRELRLHFSAYLARVRRGETLVLTDRGKPFARIEPTFRPVPPDVQRLLDEGRASYNPNAPLHLPTPVAMLPGEKTAVDYVSEQKR